MQTTYFVQYCELNKLLYVSNCMYVIINLKVYFIWFYVLLFWNTFMAIW